MTEQDARSVIRGACGRSDVRDAGITRALDGYPRTWTYEATSRDGECLRETLTVTFSVDPAGDVELEAKRRGDGPWYLDAIRRIDHWETSRMGRWP